MDSKFKAFFKKRENEGFFFAFLLLKLFKHGISAGNYRTIVPRLAAELIVLVLAALIAGAVIRASGNREKTAVTFLLVLFFASPAANDALLLDLWFKDLRVFINLFLLGSVALGFWLIEKPKWKWLLPLLCFACVALRPMFLLTFFPLIVVLIAYYISSNKKEGDYRDLMASTLVAVSLGFLLFGLKKVFLPVEQLLSGLSSAVELTAFRLATVFPLFVLFAVAAHSARRVPAEQAGSRTAVFVALLPLLSLAAPLTAKAEGPGIVMSAVFIQTCLWLWFLSRGKEPFCFAAECLVSGLRKNPLLLWLALIWLASFSGLAKTLLLSLTKTKSFFNIWK